MSTLVLWALALLLVLLSRWSDRDRPPLLWRRHSGDFWLWEHEPTREVTHE